MRVQLPIKIFVVMAEMVKDGGFQMNQWAEASDMLPARISDLNRLSKQTKSGRLQKRDDLLKKDVGRAFTLEKAYSLIGGIKKLMGKKGIEQLLTRLPELENEDQQSMLMLICLPDDQKPSARMFLQTLLKASYPGIDLQK